VTRGVDSVGVTNITSGSCNDIGINLVAERILRI